MLSDDVASWRISAYYDSGASATLSSASHSIASCPCHLRELYWRQWLRLKKVSEQHLSINAVDGDLVPPRLHSRVHGVVERDAVGVNDLHIFALCRARAHGRSILIGWALVCIILSINFKTKIVPHCKYIPCSAAIGLGQAVDDSAVGKQIPPVVVHCYDPVACLLSNRTSGRGCWCSGCRRCCTTCTRLRCGSGY